MEATQCILQLHKPIMEVCHVSFYLPRGKVRGFTYKNSATRHKSADCFDKCYQVREEAVESKRRPCENVETVLRQTTTQDILGQLYKLTAAKERLLANLLCSHRGLESKMGNQDGRLLDQQAQGDQPSAFYDVHESFSASTERKNVTTKGKKSKFGRRRESLEDFLNKKIKRKSHGNLEPPESLVGRDAKAAKDRAPPARLSVRSSSGSAARPGPHLAGNEDGGTPCAAVTEPATTATPRLHSWGTLESDTELCSSLSEYDNDVFSDCMNLMHPGESLLGEVEGAFKGMQIPGHSSFLENAFQESFEALVKSATDESWQGYEYREHSYNGHSAASVVARARDLTPCMQRVERSGPVVEQDTARDPGGESVTPVFQTVQHDFVARAEVLSLHQPERQEDKMKDPDTEGSLPVVVNKKLLKVIQSDSVDEAGEWRGLQAEGSRDRGGSTVHEAGRPFLLSLPLTSALGVSQARPQEQLQPRPVSPSLATVSNVFQTSYPASNTLQQMSPAASPHASRLPSPQLHHRILPLPAEAGEEPGPRGHVERKASTASSSSPSTSDSQPHLRGAGPEGLSSADSGIGTCAGPENWREAGQPTLPPSGESRARRPLAF
ncbi:formin-1-like [Lissotriton helveticus]